MGRKPRVWYPGAIYHVICRGNHRHNIFRDEDDRVNFLALLREVKVEYPFNVLCYCLMTNHFHIVIETIDHSITEIMRKFNWKYVYYFNKKYKFVGRLYQGRYIAKLIETDGQLLENSRYIHLNPINTKVPLCDDLTQYHWSSYNLFITNAEDDLVNKQRILSLVTGDPKQGYKDYVEAARR